MSKHYPATLEEFSEIATSVANARMPLRLKEDGPFRVWFLKWASLKNKPDYRSQKKAFLFHVRAVLSAPGAIQGADGVNTRAPKIPFRVTLMSTEQAKNILLKAAEQEDWKFFISLGKLLSTSKTLWRTAPKKTSSLRKRKTEALQRFLFDHWHYECDGLPPLCYFTRDGVAEIYSKCSDEAAGDNVKNQIRRLRLKSFSGLKIKITTLRDGRLRFDKPDNTFSYWPATLPGNL